MSEMKAKKKDEGRDEERESTTTAIYLPKRQLAVLQAVAFARMKKRAKEKERADEKGRGKENKVKVGKPSVSAVISELVQKHEEELAKEAAPFLAMFE
jgi:hypothetical protein